MDRSKALLIYGLCMVAPVLAGERPDGQDVGEVHANLPFTLSAVATGSASASAAPARESFSAIASMEHKSAAKSAAPVSSNALASINSKATSAAAASSPVSVVVIPAKSNAGPDNLEPKVTPVKFTGTPSMVVGSSSAVAATAASSSAAAAISKSAGSASALPKAPATTAAPSPLSSKTTPYIDDWRTRMTWPPGCEEWANPCPQGVPLSGGGVARTLSNNYVPVGSQSGYVNPFTSLLTMTDSNGVVTGMPSKATLPAGVTALPPWVTRTSSAAAAAPTKPASTVVVVPVSSAKGAKSTGAADAKASASVSGNAPVASKNGAATVQMASVTVLIGALGFIAALL